MNSVTKKIILMHCQYVYGIGHFIRTLEIAKSLSSEYRVIILNGGNPIENMIIPPEIELVQLPAIHKKEDSNQLIPLNCDLSIDDCFNLRREIIVNILQRINIDVLVTEHFPFGFLFKEEVLFLIKLLKEINPNCKFVSSVRDLVNSYDGSETDELTCEILNSYYDLLMIHSDKNVIPFETSFPKFKDIKISIKYTGYVTRKIITKNSKNFQLEDIALVSVGGGSMGEELQKAIIKVHLELKKNWNHKLIVFLGSYQNIELESLPASIVIHKFDQSAYDVYLRKAKLLICMGGYNTVLEAISLNLPLLVYQKAFSQNNFEQACRINELQKIGLVHSLYPNELQHSTLISKILTILKLGKNQKSMNFNGAENTKQAISLLINSQYK